MTDDKMQLALNHALSDRRMALARQGLLGAAGIDQKRPQAWCEYGWPEQIDFTDFYGAFSRGGLAYGAVTKLIGGCWKTNPWLIEGDDQDNAEKQTAWERRHKAMFKSAFWRAFREADQRRLVGRYSGLILRIRDSQTWDQPVKKKSDLVDLIPAWAGCLVPTEFHTDPASDLYGKPKFWQFKEAGLSGSPGRAIKVHPDRVFILGDYSPDAIGFLEPAFNNLVSLEKVEGGSGESFLKNAARHLSVSFDKEVDLSGIAQMYGVSIEQLHERFNDAARDVNRGSDVMLVNQGATVTPLVSNVPDPKPTYDINLQSAAAAWDIPAKILVGMQSGERASSEDQKYFNSRCQSRRNELTDEINAFIEHLMRVRVVEHVGEFTAIWDDLTAPTASDKLSNSKLLAEINQTAIATGEPAFSREEIREAAGYENDDLPPLPDEDVDDGEDADSSKQAD
mgnify:CR=1 FL=1